MSDLNNPAQNERERRWRLALGKDSGSALAALSGTDGEMDAALGKLYQSGYSRAEQGDGFAGGYGLWGGHGRSIPKAASWLADIRKFFPAPTVQIIQQDALERLDFASLLGDPEVLAMVQADVHLVATLVALQDMIPDQARESARDVVRKLVDELLRKHQPPMERAVRGALNRSQRNLRPRQNEINWNATIRKNLKHYQADYKTIIPELLVGYGRKKRQVRDIILCVDQSGSMATSVVYSSIFAAVLASLPALRLRLVVFDTAVVDMSDSLTDPVDVLFGIQLGGGTDINQAVAYCQQFVVNPKQTTFILITDLYEGGDEKRLLQRVSELLAGDVNLITLLALNDDGAPSFDQNLAGRFAALGAPAFACTPDLFPDLMATALERRDLQEWADQHEISLTPRHAEN